METFLIIIYESKDYLSFIRQCKLNEYIMRLDSCLCLVSELSLKCDDWKNQKPIPLCDHFLWQHFLPVENVCTYMGNVNIDLQSKRIVLILRTYIHTYIVQSVSKILYLLTRQAFCRAA